jgi:PAS domain S-box-containing protein
MPFNWNCSWGTVQDNQARQAENQLRESQEKYRSLFTNMLDGFIYGKMVFDEEGNASDFVFIEVNDAFEKIIGLKKDALIGKSVKQILPQIKTTYHELLSIAGRVTRSGKEEQFELFFKPFNMWLSIAVYCPRADHFAAVFQNVTERKNAEDALRENEHRWITTLSSVGDAVIATDINGKITFMNEVAEKLTGWTLKTASKKTLKHVFHIVNEFTRKEVDDPVSKVLESGKIVNLANHTLLIRKDGSEVPIDDSGSPIKDENGELSGVVLIFRDISERRKTENALKESTERLRLKLDSVLSPDVDIEDQDLANIIDVPALQATMDGLYEMTHIGFGLVDLKGKVLVGTGWQDICTKFHRLNPQTEKTASKATFFSPAG